MKLKKFAVFFITVALSVLCLVPSTFAATALIPGGDFEEDDAAVWEFYTWDNGKSSISIDKSVSYEGQGSMHIHSTGENDARFIQRIKVNPNSFYTVRAYVKTKDVLTSSSDTSRVGATIAVLDTYYRSSSVTGTTNWTQITFSFGTDAEMSEVPLCFTLGGYGALNSGDAWFDNITVEECDIEPLNCHELESKENDTSTTKVKKNYAGYSLNEYPDRAKWILFAFAIFFLLALLAISFAETGDILAPDKKLTKYFIFAIATGLVFRIVIGMFATGFIYDIGCFRAWAWYASNDLFNMYSPDKTYFLDYPPLYMYMLAPLGTLVNAGSVIGEPLALVILKLPSIIADTVSAYLIYKFAKNRIDAKWALVLATFYFMNPMVWLDSVVWGQVDSIFAMFVIAEFICVVDKKWWGAGIMFALSVLLKPHGIIFAPALGLATLVELFKNKQIKPLLKTVAAGLATCIVLLLPFYIRMGFENWDWIIKLYTGTVDSYPYVTLNGFNFWALLGFNTTNVEHVFLGLPFSKWGLIAIVIACLLGIFFTVAGSRKKIAAQSAVPTIVALVVLVTVFTFAHKMHERYMFAAAALAILAFVQTKDRNWLYLSVAFSTVVFFNVYEIYDLHIMWTYLYPEQDDIWMLIISGLEVASFVWCIIAAFRTLVFNKTSVPSSLKEDTEKEN